MDLQTLFSVDWGFVDTEIECLGTLAKVSAVSDDGMRAFFDLRNGSSGWFEQEADHFKQGDVVLISGEAGNQHIEEVSPEAWPTEAVIGVVKLVLTDITLLDSGARLIKVPTGDASTYAVGNIVEADSSTGVIRVLHTEPIRTLELPEIDDTVVQRFRSGPGAEELSFDDFGGMASVIKRARELIELPLRKHEELTRIGARPIKGVLFTGPPGTGKTMLARIIAAQSGASFYEISGPEIFSKWYGQSEDLLRKIFADATAQERAIVFFDEIDSVAGQRDEAHEASRRVVAQLLTLMDGFSSASNVVVIATTNRPQDLDVALRRPGRLDWEIAFTLPRYEDRLDILVKSARRLQTLGFLPHQFIARHTEGWSSAELAAIWSEAALLAVEDDRQAIQAEDYTGGYERVEGQRKRTGIREGRSNTV